VSAEFINFMNLQHAGVLLSPECANTFNFHVTYLNDEVFCDVTFLALSSITNLWVKKTHHSTMASSMPLT